MHIPQFQRPSFIPTMLWKTAVIVFSVVLLGCFNGGEEVGLSGTIIEDRREATNFRLTDHLGNSASLNQYNDGRVVVLSFLYTYCPDVCPIVAHHIKSVHESLGDDAGDVSIVIVSVDPERDTVERAREYSEAWGMTGSWAYLVGSEDELEPVWDAYYVSPAALEEFRATDVPEEWKVDRVRGVDALSRDIASRYTVSHQAPVYLIDRQGRMRVLHSLPITPTDVVSDIRALLREDG